VRERERDKEGERELRELRGLEGERSAHKETLLEILWCDDYLDSLHGYGTVEQRENPPRNESLTQREPKN
jgi:hypothetical protein